jgi:hypothetical protein
MLVAAVSAAVAAAAAMCAAAAAFMELPVSLYITNTEST